MGGKIGKKRSTNLNDSHHSSLTIAREKRSSEIFHNLLLSEKNIIWVGTVPKIFVKQNFLFLYQTI